MIESTLGWFGGLSSIWGGLLVKIGTHVGAGDDASVAKELQMSFLCCFGAAAVDLRDGHTVIAPYPALRCTGRFSMLHWCYGRGYHLP